MSKGETSFYRRLMAIKTSGLSEELKTLILLLASKWGDEMNLKSLNVTHLSGAMTNEVYRVSWPSHIEGVVRTILIRVYGKGVDVFFNRDDEIRTFEFISMHGHGPKLLGHFPGGRVEEFIHARVRKYLNFCTLFFILVNNLNIWCVFVLIRYCAKAKGVG